MTVVANPPDPQPTDDVAEYVALVARLSALLTGVANALKGDPGPSKMHDWSDLPVVAASAVAIAYRRAADDLDDGSLPGSSAAGHYSGYEHAGYGKAENDAAAWLRREADRLDAVAS